MSPVNTLRCYLLKGWQLIILSVVIIQVIVPLQGKAQSKLPAELKVESVRAIATISLRIKVKAKAQQLYIIYCDDSWIGSKTLCTLQGSYIEVLTDQGWKTAEQRKTFGILGAPRRDLTRNTVIEPNSEADFYFKFSRRHFLVDPGQKLRLVVQAWTNEQSMKNGVDDILLYSDTFECPKDEIIR